MDLELCTDILPAIWNRHGWWAEKFPGTPLTYEVSDKTLEIGQFGGEVDGRYYEGFKQAIERYKWHTDNDLWDYRMEDYKNEGVRQIWQS